jgi:hypothetical protein
MIGSISLVVAGFVVVSWSVRESGILQRIGV